jgi:endoglucanase
MIRKETITRTFVFLSLFYCLTAAAQAPFSRGINLTGWFQVDSPGQIQFTRFTRHDIEDIKSLGCDVIRLPVNLHSMTSGSPAYTLDPLYVSFLDSVINWCEDLQIYLIIDNHSFDPNVNTSPDIGTILIRVWSQTASHLKDRSDYILYEILNEPHGITTSAWGTIQNQVIGAIREKDTRHTIVVGGSGYNSYNELANLPVYSDNNLLYTFHFYDPFVFTHQGASWTNPSMEPLSGVPFPYDAGRMPECPGPLKGTWIESSLNSYPSEGTVTHIKQLTDIAVKFRNDRNVKIFCGEFGVYIPNCNNADRYYWYEAVRQYFEEKDIPWTTWDYKGSFGLFNQGSNELFDHDLNVYLLQALSFNVPPQTPFSIKPDSAGFLIYSDYIRSGIYDASAGSGIVNYYSTDLPNNDNYCLYWHGYSQYNTVGFDFSPDRDFTKLVAEGFAIDFMVRGNLAGIKFDLRFLDTKSTDPDDHPWRKGITIDETDVSWDRKWHHLNIPLTSLEEKGSWDNNTWYNPQGKFDWSAIDRFEISIEDAGTIGKQIWFDNIHITDLDTAIVRQYGEVGVEKINDQSALNLEVMPNPVVYNAKITYTLPAESHVNLSIYTITGIKIRTLSDDTMGPGEHSLTWNGVSDNGVPVRQGLYICVLKASNLQSSCKIIKY